MKTILPDYNLDRGGDYGSPHPTSPEAVKKEGMGKVQIINI